MKRTEDETETKDAGAEGPRGFAVLLHQVGDGSLLRELSKEIQKLTGECTSFADTYATKGKGTLTLKLSLSADPNGTVTIHGDVAVKPPPKRRNASLFWATPGNNLSVENPRQQKLPLREVPNANQSTRGVEDDGRPARSV